MNQPIFTGTATALVTPLNGGKIDFRAYDRILQEQIEAGVAGLVVCGTTGEASTLSTEEKTALWKHTVAYVGERAKVIAGVGTNDTAKSIALAKAAEDCGVRGLLAVTPYYNKCTQEGLIAHYTALAEATHLPLIAYNVPSRTGVNLLPETWKVLARHPKINGIKEASGNISQIAKCMGEKTVWSGNDDQVVPVMALGGKGVISVLSNLYPKGVVEMTGACLRGDYASAAQLQLRYLPLIERLFSVVNPIPVKGAMELRGLCTREVRLPLTAMGEEEYRKLQEEMEKLEKN